MILFNLFFVVLMVVVLVVLMVFGSAAAGDGGGGGGPDSSTGCKVWVVQNYGVLILPTIWAWDEGYRFRTAPAWIVGGHLAAGDQGCTGNICRSYWWGGATQYVMLAQ